MPANKKHHYVPRFYLRRFSADGKSINLYNVPSRTRVLQAKLKNQAYRDYFYGKQPEIEQAIAGIEGQAADVFRKIDEFRFPPPPFTAEHVALLTYIVMQLFRTKYEAEALNEMSDAMAQQVFGPQAAAEGIDLTRFRIKMAEPGAFSVALAAQISPLAMDMHYKLLVDRTGEEFVTSDNPVVACNPLLSFRTMSSNCGIAAKGLQLYFPIGPDKLMLLYDGSAYSVGPRRSPVVEVTNPADVHELNTLQMVAAGANVYFRRDDLNVDALYRKARPFFRTRKSRFQVLKEVGRPTSQSERREIFATSREDVRTHLSLSFVSVRTGVKKWREAARRQRTQPVAETRNPELVEAFHKFEEEVKQGRAQPSDFFQNVVEAGHRATYSCENGAPVE